MIGCRCKVRQIPSIRLLAASHSTCLLENKQVHTTTPRNHIQAHCHEFKKKKELTGKNNSAPEGSLFVCNQSSVDSFQDITFKVGKMVDMVQPILTLSGSN